MATLQTRVSEELKIQADALFKDMGITTTDAIRMFLTQCINQGGIPFQLRSKRLNMETVEALNEKGGTSYDDVEELSQLWK